ncbi:MAG: (d)CMP kinase [Lentisphaerae bacterium]|nr:(d)CMP kinase [Lentisphaerota bacterium]
MSRIITIDGPSASGKSTVARQIADRIGFVYVDSGALYRGMAWKALLDQIDIGNDACLDQFAHDVMFEFFLRGRAVRFYINGQEPDKELRTVEVDNVVSVVAATPAVRTRIVGWLRDMVRFGDLVIEGRDIGTAVFPQSAHKFYLDASPEQRAKRRHAEMKNGDRPSIDDTMAFLEKRDNIDSSRSTDPLKIPAGATVIDSSNMRVDEVVRQILAKLPDEWYSVR